MRLTAVRFASLLLLAVTLAPSLAHLLELPDERGLPRDARTLGWSHAGGAVPNLVAFVALVASVLRDGARR